MKIYSYLSATFLFFVLSCIDPVSFEVDHQPTMVVEGFISNDSENQTIKLSRTVSYGSGYPEPIEDASLIISDNLGNAYQLYHLKQGEYRTPAGFTPKIGATYTLHIETKEGSTYQSTPQTIPQPASIDSVYYWETTKEELEKNGNIVEKKGVQYAVNYTLPAQDTYLYWQWRGTFPFPGKTYDENGNSINCYIYEGSSNFISILDGNQYSSKRLTNQLVFHQLGYQYIEKYCLQVSQYTISKEAYLFYKGVEDQKNGGGSIFDPLPSQIQGNIYNTNNTDEIILGHFGAYGLSQDIVFVENVEISGTHISWVCNNIEPPEYCFDCRLYPGSQSTPPDYWQ